MGKRKFDRAGWAREQFEAFVEMGDSPRDAAHFVLQALAWTPEDQDPRMYLPPIEEVLKLATITEADIMDAMTDWYESEGVPEEFKKLLDATESDEQD